MQNQNKRPHAERRVKKPSAYSLIVNCLSVANLETNILKNKK
jgi:hypothetical protein